MPTSVCFVRHCRSAVCCIYNYDADDDDDEDDVDDVCDTATMVMAAHNDNEDDLYLQDAPTCVWSFLKHSFSFCYHLLKYSLFLFLILVMRKMSVYNNLLWREMKKYKKKKIFSQFYYFYVKKAAP